MDLELRKSGISVVGDVPWGTHFCHFYETKQDLLDTLVPYFKAGLESKEFCLWVVSNSELITVEEAKGALAQAVPDLDRHLSEKNIEILNGHDWYLEENGFNLERVTNAWDAKLKRALALGYDGMRVSGDTFWLPEKDSKDFFAYEKQLNESITDHPMTALCTYPLAKSGAAEVLDVVQAHQFAIARRQGEWEVIETPKLIQAKADIRRLNEDLEQRVVERTSELRLANEELRKEMIERKHAEAALDERLRFETLLTELSAAFANLSRNEVDREIDKWLQTLVEFLGVDRASFFQFEEDWTTLYRSHSYTAPGIEPLPRLPIEMKDQFPWITDQLRKGVTVKWSRIPDDLPEEAVKEKEYAARLGAKSGLNIPVRMAGSVICAITFTSVATYRDWPDVMVARLRLVGEIFAAAVERKRAEAALRKSEEQFRQMAENIREVFWLATADLSKMLYVSPAYEAVWGRTRESLYLEPRSFSAAIHDEDRARVVAIIERDREQGFEVEYRVVRPDGSIRWIRDRGFPIEDESGRFYRVAGIAEDITERKHSEEQLKLSETQLAEAQRLAHVGSWNLDLNSKTVTWSAELYRIFGVQPSEFDHRYEAVIGTTHPDDREWLKSVIEDAVNTHKPFSVYYRITRPAGEVRVLHARGVVATNKHGNATRLHGTAQDVTERKQAEDELQQQKEILQKIFDHIPLMINFVDADGRIKLVNREWERALGWSLEEIREQNLDVFPEFYPDPQYRQEVLKFIAEAKGEWSDFKTKVRDGRVMDTTFVRVLLSDRTSIGIGQDITERKQAEEARREAEKKYKEIFENAGEGIFQSTPDGRYIAANPALARMYGFASPEELIHSCQDISRQVYVDPARREEFKLGLEEQGVVRGFELEVFRKDGSTLWISVNARAVKDEQGAIQYYEGTGQDITARKIAEHGMRESEERYRELFENAKDATYVHDLDGKYTSVNRAAEKLSGYTRAEILGKTFTNFVAPEEIENIREQLCRKLVDEGETSYETEVITKDGRRVAVEVSSHIILENGIPVGVQGTARDIAERKAGEEKLKANSDQLRALSARLQSAREEEGTRIAREIHDELGSALTSLKWDLEEMDKILANSGGNPSIAALQEKLQAPIKVADTAIGAIRRIASELRPSILDDLGLVAAIEWQAQQFQARTGIVCYCDCSVEMLELSEEQSTAVFRILQEALTNVLRHAQASRVEIKINKESGHLVLSSSDNGKGITVSESSEQRSLGILGMRERAHLIGGELDIKRGEGKGTVVTVRVPISGQDRVLKMTR